jgi:hypothetical protein
VASALFSWGSQTAAAAPAQDRFDQALQPQRRDSAGAQLIINPAGRWRPLEGWTIQPQLEIGGVRAGAGAEFYRVDDAVRTSAGVIIVADGSSRELRLFAPDGRHLRTVGRQGGGPAEFQTFNGLELYRDSVFAFDAGHYRISVLDPAGNYIRGIRLDPVLVASAGPIVFRSYRLVGIHERGPVLIPRGFQSSPSARLRIHWDTLPNMLYSFTGEFTQFVGEHSGLDKFAEPTRTGSLHFGRASSADVARHRFFITDGGRYGFRVYGDGITTDIRLNVPRRKVSEADLEARFQAFARSARTRADSAQQTHRLNTHPRADSLPWIADLVVDDLGYVWVEEYLPVWDRSTPRWWGVFSPDGSFLGRIRMPIYMKITQIGADFVLGIQGYALIPDEVESVKVYTLVRR